MQWLLRFLQEGQLLLKLCGQGLDLTDMFCMNLIQALLNIVLYLIAVVQKSLCTSSASEDASIGGHTCELIGK